MALEDLPIPMAADVPTKCCARFVCLATVSAEKWLVLRVPHHVRSQIVLAAACMRAQRTFERLYPLVNPDMFLQF